MATKRAPEPRNRLEGHSEDGCSESHPWKTSCMISVDRQMTTLLETGQRTTNKVFKSLWNSIGVL